MPFERGHWVDSYGVRRCLDCDQREADCVCGAVEMCGDCGNTVEDCTCDSCCEECGGELCGSCGTCHRCEEQAEEDRREAVLYSYSDAPGRYFNMSQVARGQRRPFVKRGGFGYIGLELEVDGDPDDVDLSGYAICKSDSSLGARGMEICTVSATLERHLEALTASGIGNVKAPAHGYGLHVHVSRDAFSPLVLGKVIALVNDYEARSLIEGVCGRYDTSYVRHGSYGVKAGLDNGPSLGYGPYRNHQPVDHYAAVNVRSATVEFRTPRTSNHVPTILGRAEFPLALMGWAAATPLRLVQSSPAASFVEWWAAGGEARYPFLAAAIGGDSEVALCA